MAKWVCVTLYIFPFFSLFSIISAELMWRVRGITPCNSSSPFKAISACLSFSSLERQIASAESHILRAAVAVLVSLRAICQTATCPSKPSSKPRNSLNYPDNDFRVMSCSVFPPGTSENLKPSSPSLIQAQIILHAALTYWVLVTPRCCAEDFICEISLCHLNTLHHKKSSVSSNQERKSASCSACIREPSSSIR